MDLLTVPSGDVADMSEVQTAGRAGLIYQRLLSRPLRP